MSKLIDLTGKKFGELTVIKRAGWLGTVKGLNDYAGLFGCKSGSSVDI